MQVPAHNIWPAGHVPPHVPPLHAAIPPSGVGQGSQDVPQVATSALDTHSVSHA